MSTYMVGDNNWRLIMSFEQIEVTQNGLFGGEPDTHRKFIPGEPTYYLTLPSGKGLFISMEDVDWLMSEKPSDEEAESRFNDQLQDR